MNTKQIQVGSNKLLVLDMPVGAKDFKIFAHTWTLEPKYMPDLFRLLLPIGEYELVGLKDDITEEQWAEIVPCYGIERYHNFKAPTQYVEYLYKTAKESGLSLLQANSCNYKNALIIRVI